MSTSREYPCSSLRVQEMCAGRTYRRPQKRPNKKACQHHLAYNDNPHGTRRWQTQGTAEAVDCAAHLFLGRSQKPDEQGLERLRETSEAFIYTALSHQMARKLACW